MLLEMIEILNFTLELLAKLYEKWQLQIYLVSQLPRTCEAAFYDTLTSGPISPFLFKHLGY